MFFASERINREGGNERVTVGGCHVQFKDLLKDALDVAKLGKGGKRKKNNAGMVGMRWKCY